MIKVQETIDALKYIKNKVNGKKVYFLAFTEDDISLFRVLNYNIREIDNIILGDEIDSSYINKLLNVCKQIKTDEFTSHNFDKSAIYIWNYSGDLKKIIEKISYKNLLKFPFNFQYDEDCHKYGKFENFSFPEIGKFVLDIHITEHCNLICKSCNHYAPVAKKNNLTVENHEKQLKALKNVLGGGKFETVNILGGEPLLNKDIIQILKKTREYLPEHKIVLTTNGTLLRKMSEDFFKELIDDNILVSVSRYDTDIVDYQQIGELLSSKNIEYYINRTPIMLNSSILPNGQENGSLAYLFCGHATLCLQLKNGKVYRCPVAAHVEHFNKYFDKNVQRSVDDYFDLESGTHDDFINFLSMPVPFCCNCAIDTNEPSLYEFSKKCVFEWEKEDSENYEGYFIDKQRNEMNL